MTVNIKNLRTEKPKDPWDFIVDRTSVLGNPFAMHGGITRKQVCENYEKWFYSRTCKNTAILLPIDYKVRNYLNEIWEAHKKYKVVNLFCWCIPKQCHAETVKRYIENLNLEN